MCAVWGMSAGACRSQKKASDPLEQEFQVVRHRMLCWEPKSRSSARAVWAPNH